MDLAGNSGPESTELALAFESVIEDTLLMALKFWVEFFEELEFVRGRSRNTVQAYRRDLELYEQFLERTKDISRLYEFMSQRQLSLRSQARVVSSIRTYLKYCERNGAPAPELRQLRPPKVTAKLPRPLSLEEFEALLKACVVEDLQRTIRNQTTLLLLFGSGVRVSELIGLSLGDYRQQEGWLIVTGKGNKQRVVPLTQNLSSQVNKYLKESREDLVKVATHSLLINDRGNRPSRIDIWRWLAAWSKIAGFKEPIGPHRFRHGCATSLLDSGADLRSIQLLLGHSSIQTTQIYTTVSPTRAQAEVDKNHPLSKLKGFAEIDEP